MMIDALAVAELREKYRGLPAVNVDGPAYQRLVALLDRADDRTLDFLAHAEIKFVSSLARNRILKRGVMKS